MENVTSYTPPEILDDMDEETIRARMLENLPGDIDKTEGGFASDFTFPAAIEKADAMIVLNEIIQISFRNGHMANTSICTLAPPV